MLKLTKTGIGLLTRQYRSVLRKCWEINVGLWNWVMNTATGAASAVGGAMNALWSSSKNSAREFSELIAALLKCNFLNDAMILKNIANIFAISAKMPAEPFASLYEGTLNTFNVLDGLKHNIPKGISKVALLATVATVVMPSGRAEADANAGYLCVRANGDVYYSDNLCSYNSVSKLRNSIDWVGEGNQLIEEDIIIGSADVTISSGTILNFGVSVGGISDRLSASSTQWELITAKAVYDYVNSSINNAGYITDDDLSDYVSYDDIGDAVYKNWTNTVSSNNNNLITSGGVYSYLSNNYYTKNESDESSKRANLTTQNGDTLNKASNTFSESTNVPTHQASFTLANQNSLEITHNILQNGSSNNDSDRFANKANLPAKLLPPQSVGILDRKRFKMFADLLQQATNDNALTIITNVTTIAA